MAFLYPFSQKTAERLRAMPGPGGTHRWLAQVASGLRHLLSADKCFAFLRRCCDDFVVHRPVPDAEIEAAVEFAYAGRPLAQVNFGRHPVDWPDPNPALIAKVITDLPAAFDVEHDTGLAASDVLPRLFRPGELICTGRNTERAMVRPLEETLADADWLQFIVINPMRERTALNYRGKPSPRCQNNTGLRRHLVAEFDDPNLIKAQQARLITQLGTFVPLVLVVDSGGKSLHGWFRVDRYNARDQVRFFCVACLLGADPTRWDICGWLRMPGGLRVIEGVPAIRQRILYSNPEAAHA
ncbi:MAG TPA: hypothetical protein PKM73_18155 [Verrucomicrobiota bacterium]|nr:hypothetical protein [Verrucomicrobiota bacterium]HNU53117.1 hypothetical protein [Verrucomicrobiota bacterium]